MALTAVDKIKEIQERAEEQIKELRREAVSEVVKRISVLKDELKVLEGQYAELTGKTLAGFPATDTPQTGKQVRKRLSSDEKEALVETIRAILAAKPEGVKMSEIVSGAGESVGAVREALAKIKTKTTGAKSTTRYFLK